MSVPDICSFTTSFSTQGAAPLRRLMSSTRACSASAPSSPAGIVVAIALVLLRAPYYTAPRSAAARADMTDHRTRKLHDDVRERAVPRRTLPRTLLVAGLLIAAVLGAAHAAAPPVAPTPGKPGGILNLLQREELTTGFS